jgi:hypothetical protein
VASLGRNESIVIRLTKPQNALITLKSGHQPLWQYSDRDARPRRAYAAATENLMRRETLRRFGCLFYFIRMQRTRASACAASRYASVARRRGRIRRCRIGREIVNHHRL